MKKILIPILFLTFVNTLNFSIMIPILPFIVRQYGGGTIMYGLLLTMYPLFQFFAAPILGAWSDMQGRRPILLISQAGTLLSWIIFAVSYVIPKISIGPLMLPLMVIMFARIADGATGGNNSVSNAYLTDIIKPHERAKVFGLLGGMVGLGLIVGPAIGGLTSSFSIGYLGTAFTNITISTITLVLMYLYLPETLPKKERDDSLHFKWQDEIQFITKLRKYARNRTIKYLFFIRAFFLLVFNGFTSILVLFLIDQFGVDQRSIGFIFLLTGSYVIVNQMFVVPLVTSKIGDLKTFLAGLSLFIFFLTILQFVPSIWIYLIVIYFVNLGFSISFPTFKSMLSNHADPKKQGEIQGIDEAFLAAAAAIAPLTAGFVYAGVGKYTFGILAVGLLIPLIIFVKRFKKKTS